MKKYNVKEIIRFAGLKGKQKGNEFIGACVFHEQRGFGKDKNPSLHINTEKGLYNCWSCKASGNMYNFVIEVGLTDIDSVYDFLEQFVSLDTGSHGDISKDIKRIFNPEEEKDPELEEYRKGYHLYFKRRKINEETVRRFKAGYNKRLKRVIIPIYNTEMKNVALVGRAINDVQPRYLYTKDAPLSSTLFGCQLFQHNPEREIILVEGILDVMWMHQLGYTNTLGTMMTKIHDEQVEYLMELGARNFILFFDDDKPGVEFTLSMIGECVKYWPAVKCVMDYNDNKDPQSMSRQEIKRAIVTSKLFTEYIFEKGGGNKLKVPEV
jgi:DNA primase